MIPDNLSIMEGLLREANEQNLPSYAQMAKEILSKFGYVLEQHSNDQLSTLNRGDERLKYDQLFIEKTLETLQIH